MPNAPLLRSLPVVPLILCAVVVLPGCGGEIIVGWEEDAGTVADASIDEAAGGDVVDTGKPDVADATDGSDASSCESTGGQCLADTPGACSGAWADPATHTCAGSGMRCCVGAEADSGPPLCETSGGTCLSVGPTSCADGHWSGPTENSCHDWVGVLCCLPGPATLPEGGIGTPCETIGGLCVGLGPNLCANSLWDAPIPFLCGSSLDLGCCFPL